MGPYEIVAPLGAGGMGEVYRAAARGWPTRRDQGCRHSGERSPIRKPARPRSARDLEPQHPNICPLYDVGDQDGVDYLVMERLEGETLAAPPSCAASRSDSVAALRYRDHLRRSTPLTVKGIVHRDLKPGQCHVRRRPARNCLVFRAGADGAGMVTGLTRPSLTAPPTRTTPLTVAGNFSAHSNTWRRSSWKAWKADPRTDIFAFGAALYEMVTGTKAFGGKSQVSVMAAILEHDPPDLASLEHAAPLGVIAFRGDVPWARFGTNGGRPHATLVGNRYYLPNRCPRIPGGATPDAAGYP